MVKSKYSRRHPNGCRFCPKVFCCSECRDKHEHAKHPEPKCSMCVFQSQPFQFKRNASSSHLKDKLLWHIAFNHLPVYCRICGETYGTNQEFLSAKPCRGHRDIPEVKSPQEVALKVPESGLDVNDNESKSTSSTALKNSIGLSTPQIVLSDSNKSCIIASHHKAAQQHQNNDSLDSPPVEDNNNLVRQTSTPVHCAKSEVLSVRTLKKQTLLAQLQDFQVVDSLANYSCSPKDLVDFHSLREKVCSTPTTILKKKPSSVHPDILDRLSGSASNSSSEKRRVRFSDQLPELPKDTSGDIFVMEMDKVTTTEADSTEAPKVEDQEKINVEEQENVNVEEQEKDNVEEAKEEDQDSTRETNDDGEEEPVQKSSSRMVMMLLVEQTDSTDLSKLDLRPLVETGLKQLQQIPRVEMPVLSGRRSSSWCSAGTPEPEAARQNLPRSRSFTEGSLSEGNKTKSEGLFSAMARVVRNALSKLPGSLSSRNSSPTEEPRPRRRTSSTSKTTTTTTEIITVVPGSADRVPQEVKVPVVPQGSMKRRRSNSVDESAVSGSKENIFGNGRIDSPAPKRHRSCWYRHIKGRDPIARMRRNSAGNITFDLAVKTD